MNSDLTLQQRGTFGRKRKIRLAERDSWLLASGGADIVSVGGLPEGGSVAIYKEDGEWLMMAIDAEFALNDEVKQSAVLASGDRLHIGDTIFDVKEGNTKPVKEQVSEQGQVEKEPNKTRRLLLVGLSVALAFLAVVIATSGKKESNLSDEVVLDAGQNSAIVNKPDQGSAAKVVPGDAAEVSDDSTEKDIKTEAVQSPIIQNSGAYEYYRRASNYYDLGFLQRAIKTLQQGLEAHPNDTILANKLDAWQRNLSMELSRQFRDGCLHARYFRNLEAKHAFAMVVEMSINESDIRFKEAQRLLEKLKKDAAAKVECGMKTDEN